MSKWSSSLKPVLRGKQPWPPPQRNDARRPTIWTRRPCEDSNCINFNLQFDFSCFTCSGNLSGRLSYFGGIPLFPSLKGRLLLARSSVATFPLISVALPRPFQPANMHHCWLSYLQKNIAKHSFRKEEWESPRKYREYREHALNSRVFFSHKGVAGGKVDEDRVLCVWLQESADDVVLFQPVLSEKCSCENSLKRNAGIIFHLAIVTASMTRWSLRWRGNSWTEASAKLA